MPYAWQTTPPRLGHRTASMKARLGEVKKNPNFGTWESIPKCTRYPFWHCLGEFPVVQTDPRWPAFLFVIDYSCLPSPKLSGNKEVDPLLVREIKGPRLLLEYAPMLRKPVLVVLGLLLAAGLVAAQDKAKKDDKDTSKTIAGKVTKVDATKNTVSVTTDDGKKMDLTVTDDTKIVGPRGGISKDRLKDDRLTVGAEIKVTMDGKKVKQIELPARKSGDKK